MRVPGGRVSGPVVTLPKGRIADGRVLPYTQYMVRVIQEHGVTIVCTGPSYAALELRALEELGESLLSEATNASPPRLIVDMSETGFVGSSFIELLVRAWKRIQSRHGMMTLCAVRPFCHEVLSVSRLDTIWPIYASREEALNALAALSEGV